MRPKRDFQISTLLALLRSSGFSRKHKGLYLLLAVILLGLSLYFKSGSKTQLDDGGEYTVADMIDGGTVALNGSDKHIRYLEIDALRFFIEIRPETPSLRRQRV